MNNDPTYLLRKAKQSSLLPDDCKSDYLTDLKEFENIQEKEIQVSKDKIKEFLKGDNYKEVENQIFEILSFC
ncbi:MAG: hypothetical protein COA88_15705 [Kordia sp.]|nr:MAG: hypothetical protein COA88_15705 [Kordia sp.]